MNGKYEPLFQSHKFKCGLEVDNRLVMAPMTHFSSLEDGTSSEAELQYYTRRSQGLGMIITACAYITPNGKGFAGEPSAASDEVIPSLAKVAAAIKQNGTKAILQLNHGGRRCDPAMVPDGDVIGPSPVAYARPDRVQLPVPREMSAEEIEAMVKAFGESVRRAIEAGFDGVELHGANGYLLQQFFSPHSNRRTDDWGGSIRNRMNFPLAVVEEITRVREKYATKPFVLGYRFSPEEPETPGITMDETLLLVDELANTGLDYLHVSLGDFWSNPKRGAKGYSERSRLEIIKKQTGDRIPVIGVGSIFTPDDALDAYNTGIDLVAIGRELIIEPDWIDKVRSGNEGSLMTRLDPSLKEELVIPEELWSEIMGTPNWFPVKAANP
ncbi:NADH-dependent flavin oxidoreductase [Paenibacillus xylaniclasticus]|uniref:NADH-dependent flavin oxidoreductase n=1 Tax=Paenibacillus xylaniclasticus TaxID=588083 RepID=UPI000FD7BA19|nr:MULTISPECIES: NADH-dependent flavin oxidoreductase [Paenibacillus]GFN33159.1 putative NADH-dependent flavin oxidoreductase YqiG [Paenibacillus curdlanolyticus]